MEMKDNFAWISVQIWFRTGFHSLRRRNDERNRVDI